MAAKPTLPFLRNYLGDPLGPLREDWPVVTQALEGGGKGFFLYLVPFTLLRRRLEWIQVRRALACGVFVSVVRIIHTQLQLARDYFHTNEKRAREAREGLNLPRSSSSSSLLKMDQPDGFYLIKAVLNYPRPVAAAIAAIIALMVDPGIGNRLFVLWCLVRAIRLISPDIPGASLLGLSLSAGHILSNVVFHPEFTNPPYLKFLYIHGAITPKAVQKWHEAAIYQAAPNANLCTCFHVTEAKCHIHWLNFMKSEFKLALKVYAPMYLVFFLLGRNKNPVRLFTNIVRSAIFLTVYTGIAHCVICSFFKLSPGVTRTKMWLITCICGLAGLLETKHRRAELSAYCVTYALDAVLAELLGKKIVPYLRYAAPTVLAFSAAILLQNHDAHLPFFSKWLLNLP